MKVEEGSKGRGMEATCVGVLDNGNPQKNGNWLAFSGRGNSICKVPMGGMFSLTGRKQELGSRESHTGGTEERPKADSVSQALDS